MFLIVVSLILIAAAIIYIIFNAGSRSNDVRKWD